METPHKGKHVAIEQTVNSPKNFRWSQPYEDTLLDLLVREVRNGNRPDASFTSTAFRNVVNDFNRIHGTSIMKKHVLSRIKTMKAHFNQFHAAFNGLSGFSWNHETQMFEAEEYLWEQRIQENPNMRRLRDKPCHNWDTLCELYGDTRTNGASSISLKSKSARIQRGLHFAKLRIHSQELNVEANSPNDCSSYADYSFSKEDADPSPTQKVGSTHQTGGSQSSKLKRKASFISVVEDGYKYMAESFRELSAAVIGTGDKLAGTKYDPRQNEEIYAAIESLGLDEEYKFRCYCYLTSNPSKAAQIVGAPTAMRGKMLDTLMASAGGA